MHTHKRKLLFDFEYVVFFWNVQFWGHYFGVFRVRVPALSSLSNAEPSWLWVWDLCSLAEVSQGVSFQPSP